MAQRPPEPAADGLRMTTRLIRLSALAAAAVLPLLISAPASAATGPQPTPGCYFHNSDGTITAVFGYSSDTATSIPQGQNNAVFSGHSISNYWVSASQPEPTSFKSGTLRSVFSVNAPGDGGAAWYLNGNYVIVSPQSPYNSPECLKGTDLPAMNPGVLAVLGLAVIAPIGGWALSRRSTKLAAVRSDVEG